ncbi:hypothetical protein PVAND_000094 [Polypedilum vanderplanki]|uniref:SCP domain-containing protein n=1 Tax=Polypedilum vanderplanki TaxID=319348 RepID=A0A9J6BIS8_POLVA|nr:hypothetical protein PVAND_000094 [Polypedilum vanderplanki]
MKLASVKIFIILIAFGIADAVDYCKLCSDHIACNNNGQFASTCPRDATMVTFSNQHIQTLLNAHNNARNTIAGGGVSKLRTASKMMTLRWDNELAYLAALNVRQCKMQHDRCRSTQKYKYAGQNLYWSGSSNYGDIINDLIGAVNAWYNEVKDVSQSDIDKCCGGKNFSKIGHFLQMVQDRAVAVGCAAFRYTSGTWKATLIACNYSFGNMGNDRVYVSGPTASACSSGRNPNFKNLCN